MAQPGSAIPQTDAALSQKLLSILQYRKTTDTTPPNNDKETEVSRIPEGLANAAHHQTPSRYPAYGIDQQFGEDRGPNDKNFPQPFRSGTFTTVESDVLEMAPSYHWPMIPMISPQGQLDQAPETANDVQDTEESPVDIPKISIHPLNSISSDTSNLRIGDYQTSTPTDDLRTDRGAPGLGNNAWDSRTRKIQRKPGSQRLISPEKILDGHGQDLLILPTVKPKRNPANLGPETIERTPSRSSSINKGEDAISDYDAEI